VTYALSSRYVPHTNPIANGTAKSAAHNKASERSPIFGCQEPESTESSKRFITQPDNAHEHAEYPQLEANNQYLAFGTLAACPKLFLILGFYTQPHNWQIEATSPLTKIGSTIRQFATGQWCSIIQSNVTLPGER
jgi:hypothetical protein